MAKMQLKRADSPDERRPFVARGEAKIYKLGDGSVGIARFEPGWRWKTDVGPLAGTDSCESAHSLYVVSGRMRVRMNDGEEIEQGPGDLAIIPPGHDAWVVGDEACVLLDWSGMEHYAETGAGVSGREAQAAQEQGAPAVH